MATVYYTADLDSYVSMVDAALAFEVVVLKPILQQQKEQARRQGLSDDCANRLNALLAAMDSYLEDHENRYPSADGWVAALRPYVEDENGFKCPEDTSDGLSSYGMNAALSGVSPDEVADPTTTVLFYETAHPGENPSGGADDVVTPPRHVDGNNFAFVDGSVGAYGEDEMEELTWSPEEGAGEGEGDSGSEEGGEGA
jgi:prepilin-type processing-associated H-X9-DG protein